MTCFSLSTASIGTLSLLYLDLIYTMALDASPCPSFFHFSYPFLYPLLSILLIFSPSPSLPPTPTEQRRSGEKASANKNNLISSFKAKKGTHTYTPTHEQSHVSSIISIHFSNFVSIQYGFDAHFLSFTASALSYLLLFTHHICSSIF